MTHTDRRAREAQRREAKRTARRETMLACVVFIVFMLVLGRVGYWETHYYREGEVVSVSGQLVEVEDRIGYTWEFYGDGFHKGDNVKMLMFNNGTDNIITDDEIENVKLR